MSPDWAKPAAAGLVQLQRKSMKYTIATGNPVDGFKLLGVFHTREEALRYGEASNIPNDWTIIGIIPTYGMTRG